VRAWHKEHVENALAARAAAARERGYGDNFWKEVGEYAAAHGIAMTVQQYSYIHHETILRKLRKQGIIPKAQPISHRTSSLKEAAMQLNLQPVTVHRWTSNGAPHDRVLFGRKEVILVDAEELRKWAGDRNAVKRSEPA